MTGPDDWGAVLFDLDGTLADTFGLIVQCYHHTMRTHLGRELPEEPWLATIGRPLRESLSGFGRDEAEVERMVVTYRDYQRTVHDRMVGAYPGARPTLDALAGRGVPVAIVTSKSREIAGRTLACCGLSDYFDVVVTPEDVTRAKPDPEPVRLALHRLGGVAPERTLFVGDATWDVRAGKAAGVRTAAVPPGAWARDALRLAAPDFLVDRIEEVLELRPTGPRSRSRSARPGTGPSG